MLLWILVKVSACNAGDLDSIPGWGRSPGEGNGNPLQYSCLENPMDGGAWWATVPGVAKSRTRVSDLTLTFTLNFVELFYLLSLEIFLNFLNNMFICVDSVLWFLFSNVLWFLFSNNPYNSLKLNSWNKCLWYSSHPLILLFFVISCFLSWFCINYIFYPWYFLPVSPYLKLPFFFSVWSLILKAYS